MRRDARGFVTAETAVVLPALVVLLCGLLWAVAAVTAQLRCVDAARLAARALARGEAEGAARAAAASAAPAGVRITVVRAGDVVRVQVAGSVRPPGPLLGRAPGVAVSATATAAVEGSDAG